MMLRNCRGAVVLLASLLVLASAGCSKKPKPAVTPPPEQTQTTPTPPPAQPETPVQQPTETRPTTVELKDVFFDFDKFNLRDDAKGTLDSDGKQLVDAAGTNVLLEGHCDERGTVEYNLALGQKRADAVKSYLVQYGVDASKLSTISYGEERPFAQGHDEAAWSLNRRVHFVKK